MTDMSSKDEGVGRDLYDRKSLFLILWLVTVQVIASGMGDGYSNIKQREDKMQIWKESICSFEEHAFV